MASGDVLGGLVKVIHLKEVRIVDAGQVDEGAAALQDRRFVEQHADAQRLDVGHHADGIVVAQNGMDRAAQMRPHLSQRLDGGLMGTMGFGPEVAGYDAGVVAHLFQALDQCGGVATVHVQVQVAEMKQGEVVQGVRQLGNDNFVVADLDGGGVAYPGDTAPGNAGSSG